MGRSVRAAAAVLADAAASGRCTAARAAKLSDRIQWPMGIGHSCCMNRIHVTRMGPRPPQSFTVIQRSTALYSIQLYIASPIHYTPSTTPSDIGRHLSPQTTAAPRPPLSPPPPAILRRRLLAYSAAASSSAGSSAAASDASSDDAASSNAAGSRPPPPARVGWLVPHFPHFRPRKLVGWCPILRTVRDLTRQLSKTPERRSESDCRQARGPGDVRGGLWTR